jgi:hypothetical protein
MVTVVSPQRGFQGFSPKDAADAANLQPDILANKRRSSCRT